MNVRRAMATAREVVGEIRENHLTFMAGSVAHSAFLSLLPLLLLVLVIAVAVGNDVLARRITEMAQAHLSPAGEGLVFDALVNASERAGASVVGVVSLVWGMLRIFRGLNTAFDQLYAAGEASFVGQIVDGLVAFLAVTVAIVGTGAATALLGLVEHPVATALNPVMLVGGLAAAFYPMYYLFPEPDLALREAVPGTIVAAVGWALLEVAFGVYVGLVETVSTYGLLGAVIVLLIWLYLGAFLLLAGATVNVVLAGRHRDGDGDSEGREARQEARDRRGGLSGVWV